MRTAGTMHKDKEEEDIVCLAICNQPRTIDLRFYKLTAEQLYQVCVPYVCHVLVLVWLCEPVSVNVGVRACVRVCVCVCVLKALSHQIDSWDASPRGQVDGWALSLNTKIYQLILF